MKILYLDYNVVSYFRTGNFSEKISFEQKNIVDFLKRKYSIAFSPAHLEDIAASKIRCGTSDEIIKNEIDFLTYLAENHSMRPITREKLEIYYDEYPIDCYKRVIKYYENNNWAEKIEKELIYEANENKSSTPREMNNLPQNKVLDNVDYKKLISFHLIQNGLLDSDGFLKSLTWTFVDIKERFNVVEMYINIAANILEYIGYYRESNKNFRSRMHDVSHIIYGAYSDLFISEDKKIRKKAQAIYSMLKIPTRVLSLSEFKEELND